jgi:dihydroxyacid dehydratase/phosphogluconate dehydratase
MGWVATRRGNPIDGVVLLTGCDKTTPALLMGAASVDVPSIVLPGKLHFAPPSATTIPSAHPHLLH